MKLSQSYEALGSPEAFTKSDSFLSYALCPGIFNCFFKYRSSAAELFLFVTAIFWPLHLKTSIIT